MGSENDLLKGLPPLEKLVERANAAAQQSGIEAPRSDDKVLISTSLQTTIAIRQINRHLVPYEFIINYTWHSFDLPDANFHKGESLCEEMNVTTEQIKKGLCPFALEVKKENSWSQLIFCFYKPRGSYADSHYRSSDDATPLLFNIVSLNTPGIIRKSCINLAENAQREYVVGLINSSHGYETKAKS